MSGDEAFVQILCIVVAVLTWGGLRGALSMVLALSLPIDFPHRAQLIAMTYGVVLLSLVLQGMSMPWLIRRLGLGRDAASSPRS